MRGSTHCVVCECRRLLLLSTGNGVIDFRKFSMVIVTMMQAVRFRRRSSMLLQLNVTTSYSASPAASDTIIFPRQYVSPYDGRRQRACAQCYAPDDGCHVTVAKHRIRWGCDSCVSCTSNGAGTLYGYNAL